MKLRNYLMIFAMSALPILIVAACGDEQEEDVGCGPDGESVEVDSTTYCVYRQAVVVENGFECPPDQQFLTEFGAIGVCSDTQEIPEQDLATVEEVYQEQDPDAFASCTTDADCSGGLICRNDYCSAATTTTNNGGTNNGGTNNGTTNNGTTNNGTTNNGGTNNGAPCRTDAECDPGLSCINGLCG